MGLLEILMLGVALATDAFSVTISNTFAFDDHGVSRLMRMPLFFGLFQFGMPLAGYFVGGIAAELIEKYAGIVSLVILGLGLFWISSIWSWRECLKRMSLLTF